MNSNKKDLRTFLGLVQQKMPDSLLTVNKEMSLQYESTALVKKLASAGRDPIVHFKSVAGHSHSLVCNLFADRDAVALALDGASSRLNENYLKKILSPLPPERVDNAPVKEIIHTGGDPDLLSLPVPKHHEDDAGAYISAGVCIASNLDGTTVNMGMYRFMVSGPIEGGIFINPNHHGGELLRRAELNNEHLEMAIVIGHHPAFVIASQNNEPFGTDDYALAGSLLGEPLGIVPSETLSFPVPADAEMIIEGEILSGARKDEAPFGEYTMNYGLKRKSPVFRVKAITHRQDYIYHDIIPSSKEHLGLWIMPSKEANLYKKIKTVFPTIKDVRLPLNGSGYHAYISIEKVRDGDGKNVLLTLLGSEYMVKHAIVVDDDVDIFNDDEVLWAVSTRVQADQDVFFVKGARSSVLDPSSYGLDSIFSGEGMVTKMGIDATRPISKEFPNRVKVPDEVWDIIHLDDYIY